VELTRKAARVTWLQPLVDQLQKMPEIIERTGELIQRSVEFVETTILISKPLRDRWKSYKMNSFTFALSEIKDTGSALQATAREMKRIRDSRKVVMQNDDFNLERVRDLILKGNSPPQRWIFRIESLNFENYSTLRDVSPLKNLTELKELYLGRTSVIDLSPLSYLSKLRILTLNETRVIDFYTLSLLKMLEILNLSKTQIRDLSPLSKLGRLKTVDLSHTRVANIEPLAGALALESLDVRDSRVRDFAALNELSRLRVVFVSSLDAATAVDRALGRVGIASM
jgi:Leucine-rich repeat (LRR) protein